MARGPEKSFDRETVIKLAMLEFWKRGYSATSMTVLRDRTGLGAKSLYDTFGNKRQLFMACLDHYGEKIVDRTFDPLTRDHPPETALKMVIGNLVAMNRENPTLGCLLGVAAAGIEDDPELSAVVRKNLGRVQAKLAGVIDRCLPADNDGGGRAAQVSDMASMLMALLQGMHVVSRTQAGSEHVQAAGRCAERMIDRFLGQGG